MTPAVLSSREAARYVRLGKHAFHAAVNAGEIAFIDDAGVRRFRPEDLDRYLAWKRRPARWESEPQRQPEAQPERRPLFVLPTGMNPITRRRYGESGR